MLIFDTPLFFCWSDWIIFSFLWSAFCSSFFYEQPVKFMMMFPLQDPFWLMQPVVEQYSQPSSSVHFWQLNVVGQDDVGVGGTVGGVGVVAGAYDSVHCVVTNSHDPLQPA